jgi:hypothetical protein
MVVRIATAKGKVVVGGGGGRGGRKRASRTMTEREARIRSDKSRTKR